MSVVTLFQNRDDIVVSKPLITFVSQIKKGNYADSVDRLRDMYHRRLDTMFDQQKRQIPRMSIAGNFKMEGDKLELVSYSGFLYFELVYLKPDRMREVRAVLEGNPYVFACFKNTLAFGVCFIVRTEVGQWLHPIIFKKAHDYFSKVLKVRRLQKSGKRIQYLCMMSYDTQARVNPASLPFPYYGDPKH